MFVRACSYRNTTRIMVLLMRAFPHATKHSCSLGQAYRYYYPATVNFQRSKQQFFERESLVEPKYRTVNRYSLFRDYSQSSKSGLNTANNERRILNKDSELLPKRELSTLSLKGILDSAPSSLQPYLKLIRFDKPIGTWLLYLPCLWSIGLATPAGHLPDPYMIALFGAGSFLMRGAGCIINDMADRDFDGKVERTKTRPLVSGELTTLQALTYLAGHLSLSLAILLQFNWYSVILGASSMTLVLIYPFMKRYTYWPQAVLGITLNWGVLISWSAVHGCMTGAGLALYFACALWTVYYDSVYAHQDKEDDAIIGVKSTALKFGDSTKYWLTGFTSLMLPSLAAAGVMAEQTWPYYVGLGAVSAHLTRQIYTLDIDNPADCGAKFRSNKNLGLMFFVAIVASVYLKEAKEAKEKKDSVDVLKNH